LITADLAGNVIVGQAAALLVVWADVDDLATAAHLLSRIVRVDTAALVVVVVFASVRVDRIASAALLIRGIVRLGAAALNVGRCLVENEARAAQLTVKVIDVAFAANGPTQARRRLNGGATAGLID